MYIYLSLSLSIYIYIHTYIHTYVYVCVYIYIYSVCVYIYIYIGFCRSGASPLDSHPTRPSIFCEARRFFRNLFSIRSYAQSTY